MRSPVDPAEHHPEFEIAVDDPRRGDVAALLGIHLAFALGETSACHAHALDPDGLVSGGVTLFVARQAGELLGFGGYRWIGPGHVEIKSMHTAVHARGRGVARALLARLLAEARALGAERVSLETCTTPDFAPARRLYERFGFVPSGPFGGYPGSAENAFFTLALRESHAGPTGSR